jgi:DNA-binding MarR family transcriptional regulator
LNATELLVYALLWSEKKLTVYKPDSAIASETGLSERTVSRCLQSLREHRLIRCVTKERDVLAKIKRKGQDLADALARTDKTRLQPLGLTPGTRIRQITLCDPERPGVDCTPRTVFQRWLDFSEIRPGDVRELLGQLGVRIFNDNGSVIYCEIPGTTRCRKVDPATGFSLLPTDENTEKGKRKYIRESVWELAERYKGENGLDIVRQWYDELVKRNVVQNRAGLVA